MARAQTPDRIEREKIDGIKTKLAVYLTDPDHAARIEVEREERWQFGVDGDGEATVLETTATADDLAADPDIPEWLVDSLYGLGVEAVET